MSLFNRWIVSTLPLVPKGIVRKISQRYVAGETLREAVEIIQGVNSKNMMATIDLLGEEVNDKAQAIGYVGTDLEILRSLADLKLDCNLSIKPTAVGLKIDAQFCYENTKKILEEAKRLGNFVRFEMEDSSCTEQTIQVFERLRAEYDNVGIVIQAYLRRSLQDLRRLSRIQGLNIRLVKGVYVEPSRIAFTNREVINKNYAWMLEEAFRNQVYVAIATHDEELIWAALQLIDRYQLKANQYEFQMLLGVGEHYQQALLDAGHRVRVYVPYGKDWYGYCTRRLRENPKIAGYVMKDLFGS